MFDVVEVSPRKRPSEPASGFLSYDRTGLHWVFAVPATYFLVQALERFWRGGDDSIICCGPPELSLLQGVYLAVCVAYLLYPTILGWALVSVPCVFVFALWLRLGELATVFDVVILFALGLLCVGLWRSRPTLAPRRIVLGSISIALVLEGIVFGPAMWNMA